MTNEEYPGTAMARKDGDIVQLSISMNPACQKLLAMPKN